MDAVLTENLSGDVLSSCLFVVPKVASDNVSSTYRAMESGVLT